MFQEQRRSIRARLVALVLVPSAALLALWIVFTSVLLSDMLALRSNTTLAEEVGAPALEVIGALQAERRHSMEHIAQASEEDRTPESGPKARIRGWTDTRLSAFHSAVAGVGGLPSEAETRITHFNESLELLDAHREKIDDDNPTRANAVSVYDNAIEAGLRIWDTQVELSDPSLAPQARSLTSLMRARELLSQEDALVTYAVTADSFTATDHAAFFSTVGAQRFLFTQVAPDTAQSEFAIYEDVTTSGPFRTLRSLEDEVIGAGPDGGSTIPIDGQSWQSAAQAADTTLQEVQEERTTEIITASEDAATRLLLGVLASSTLAMLAVIASILFSLRLTRNLHQRLHKLREAAFDYATTRLPAITARLRTGESVDVETDTPTIPVERHDEIGQVTEAFNMAQHAAVDSAVKEAQLRSGVRNVFRNVARRTQGLVHRQLRLLDTLQQSETEPSVLDSLFRIDHLSTQMRRNAENLMLLTSGGQTQSALETAPLNDVIRAAASEIENYARVEVLSAPNVAVRNAAVDNVVRVLAELLENATSFSPPHTRVTVRSEAIAHGCYAVEVEDRGLGMAKSDYERINALLSASEKFDVADMREDSQLGLLVVATIAQRHGLKVSLRPSPYNGTQAIVVLPAEIITDDTGKLESPLASPAPLPQPQEDAPETRPVPLQKDPPDGEAESPAPSWNGETYKGLPRRVRTSARKEKKKGEEVPPSPPPVPATNRDERSLEEIRAMMSAFQVGTNAGRQHDDSDHDNLEGR
ncbi:sensor histidine kinase [Allosalinactinospora lopnorensis]|uniref:sensor histidine kinase n=1 Tax=Allosalinactinospora lopnorensis TaxID=1352348 RepID=UPI000623DE79|nr:nitrate- and nitrite sensing domain-containing protein [Allosalinactinospora lopnorensis]